MYVLKCSDDSFYTGITNDLDKRILAHKSGTGSKYVRSHLPIELIYHCAYSSKKEALRAEALFKTLSRSEKIKFLESVNVNCSLCSKQTKKLLIKGFKYWDVLLRENQNYLGWCIVALKRHELDLTQLSKNEQIELFQIFRKLKKSITKVFNPDKFNYAAFCNVEEHLHFQVIPRYKTKRIFEAIEFKDQNFGKNYSPYDKSFEVDDRILSKLVNAIEL